MSDEPRITDALISELRFRVKCWEQRETTSTEEYEVVMACTPPMLDEIARLRAEVERLERDKGILIGQSVEAGRLFNEMKAEVERLKRARDAAANVEEHWIEVASVVLCDTDYCRPLSAAMSGLRAALDAEKRQADSTADHDNPSNHAGK